jgi:hypothetical protein
MKKAAGPQARIPEHQTSHQGGVRGGQIGYTDTDLGPQSTYTPNLKRSRSREAVMRTEEGVRAAPRA